MRTTVTALAVWILSVGLVMPADELPKMQFNDVKEIAPGVFFRYSSISATDPSIPFGGCNNTWVVFKDYVVVIDANFPIQAADVVAAIKKTTNKPIRYVLDTHHHGDHAYGNAVWAKEGAKIVASKPTGRLLETRGPQQFAQAKAGNDGPKHIGEGMFKPADITFDDKYVLDDGAQRVELIHVGHMHTAGDAMAYLPKHKILCTGDACVNGAFNFMGHSNSASWIRCLDKLQEFDVNLICPGHGQLARKDLLNRQKRYFEELRQQVEKGIKDKKELKEIAAKIDMPWYKEWTGKDASKNDDNVKHVFDELQGKVNHAELGSNLEWSEGESYNRRTPGWSPPRLIVVPNLAPARLAELKELAPNVEFVIARTSAELAKLSTDADAVLGFCNHELAASKKLHWVQLAATERDARLFAELRKAGVSLTQTRDVQHQWPLWRENVRRFAAGERLVGVVE
jgi:glyoxylase-like metal-dependent hydrolase (beta-lactamase superfamily II)